MHRLVLSAAVLLAAGGAAFAQSPVQRGDYLVNSILNCGGCHSPRGPDAATKPLSGGNLFESPAFKVYTSNLTPDKETGLGNWTADQIKNAIMKGVRPDGTLLAVMPSDYYTVLTQRDADAIVAYLRSLKPVKNAGAGARIQGRGEAGRVGAGDGQDQPQGAPRLLSRDHRPLHGMPFAAREGRLAGRDPDGRGQARIQRAVGRLDRAQHHLRQGEGARKPGPMPRSSGRSRPA